VILNTLPTMDLDSGLYEVDSEASSVLSTGVAGDEPDSEILLDRRHFHSTFESETYLKSFYNRVEEPAMQVVLIFLPKIVARLEQRHEGKAALETLLDFGAGPTIHVAVCFRSLI
jgi:hypothetical protein